MKSKIIFTLIASVTMLQLAAQNDVSPYSILGVGDIESGYYGKWAGMGNTGVALSSNRFLNQANAAALSNLDNQFFVFEISGRYKYTHYLNSATGSGVINTHSDDLSMKKLALGLKLTKKWGSGVGLQPFSYSNYSFYSTKALQGSNIETNVYNQGSGGLTQIYWANSYTLFKNFNAGIQTGYLFGSLAQEEVLATNATDANITTTKNIFLRNPYLTYSFLYGGKISNKLKLGLGATYAAQTSLNAEYSIKVSDGTTDLVADEVVKTSNYNIPKTYTAGISLTYNDKFTLASDYKSQNWSNLNYKGLNYQLVNSDKYSVGLEYSKKINAYGVPIERTFYQAGFFYNNSYLQINNTQLKDYGITLGIGGNSKRNSLGYQFGMQVGSRGTTDNSLIKESYTQFMFTLSYRDFWFTKGRKYD